MDRSSPGYGHSVNHTVAKRYESLARGAVRGSRSLLGPAPTPKELWDEFLWQLEPTLTLAVIASKARLREAHPHGWTLAVPEAHLQILCRRRDRLEAALTRAHNGSPKCVHLVELGK